MSGCIATLSGAQYAAWIELAIITQITMDDAFDVESLLSGDIVLGNLGGLQYQIGKDLRKLGKNTMNCVSWTVLAAGRG